MDGSATIAEGVLGRPHVRVEGRSKVTGMAVYAFNTREGTVAHAALVTSTTAKGRIIGFDLAAAEGVSGCPSSDDLRRLAMLRN